MTRTFSKTLVASVLTATSSVALAELTTNIGAVSNYLFRGVTQTDDQAAIQGGVDYGHDSGLYAGTWLSNVDFADAEVDLYGGFGGDAGGLGYDIGALYYYYPNGGNIDYAEISGGLSYSIVSANVAYTVWGEIDDDGAFDDGDIYYNLSAELPLQDDYSVGAQFGRYDFDNADSYNHWGLSLNKDAGDFGAFSLNYEQTNGDDNDDVATDDTAKIWVGWTKEF